MHKALGKGLEALIPRSAAVSESKISGDKETEVFVEKILPNKNQPRKYFDENKINELADSIKKHGLAQPLLVKASKTAGEYELIAGERRLRAAVLAGLDKLPVLIRDVSENERFQLALIENLQREDLNPIEQAQAFKAIMDQNNLTQENVAELLSLSRSKVANILRLLNLQDDLKDLISRGLIPSSQARSLVAIEDDDKRRELAGRIINEKLTAREVERFAADWKYAISSKRVKPARRKNPEVRQMEESMQRFLGTKVEITHRKKGGSIRIEYYSDDDLGRVVNIIQGSKKK